MNEKCNICLKLNENLRVLNDPHSTNTLILNKLKICVPEIDWNISLKLCLNCENELNKLHAFKELCIQSYKMLQMKNLYKENNEDPSKIFDEYFGEVKSDATFICYHCNQHFKEKSKLISHIRQTHSSDVRIRRRKQYNCANCLKNYTTGMALKKHIKCCLKTTEVPKDEICKINIIENDELCNTIPTCGLCGTTFSNKYLLNRHTRNVHATEKKFKCDTCDRTFVSSVYLNAHKRYHTGERSHICSFCGKGFITTSDLYHHEKIHANKRAYRCEICPKAFNTSSDLHKHKVCVHLDRSKWKFECTYCKRRFPLKTNLDTHTKTHTGEKNFACHLCDRKCINKSVLRRHIETHSNAVSFKCDLCLQRYKYQKSLDAHMAKIHGIGSMKVVERVKKYFCHLCPKGYYDNSKLQKHIRTHTGERPFRCPVCDKCFIDKSYVKQHVKLAHGLNAGEFEENQTFYSTVG